MNHCFGFQLLKKIKKLNHSQMHYHSDIWLLVHIHFSFWAEIWMIWWHPPSLSLSPPPGFVGPIFVWLFTSWAKIDFFVLSPVCSSKSGRWRTFGVRGKCRAPLVWIEMFSSIAISKKSGCSLPLRYLCDLFVFSGCESLVRSCPACLMKLYLTSMLIA